MALLHMFSTGVPLTLNRYKMLMFVKYGICIITGVNISITPIGSVAVKPKTCYDYSDSEVCIIRVAS